MVDTDSLEHAPADLTAIDGPKALELLRRAVATRGPDYVYKPPPSGNCVYVAAGKPSCVVGVALSLHGVSLSVLTELDGGDGGTSTAAYVLDGHYDWVSPSAAGVFGAAQEIQDRASIAAYEPADCTWGRALEAAEARLAESVQS